MPITSHALNIVLNFDDSNPNTHESDPDGTLLSSIMTAAAQHWEDIIEDDHTLIVDFWWENLSSSTLASHQLIAQSGGRETRATIRYDTESSGTPRNWFFDLTPQLNEEFDLSQSLYRNLSSTDKTTGYSTTPPGILEAGYQGNAASSSPASGKFDLLSVAMHEIGHALGLSSANNATKDETKDGDYDSPPELLDGTSVGIKTASSTNIAHLDHDETLLYSFTFSSRRTLPSATDIFASAASSDWTQIDLKRQDFIAHTDFNTPTNWAGNSVPDADDLAAIRPDSPVNVTLSANTTVKELIVDNNSSLNTNTNDLTTAITTIGPSSTLTIADATFTTDTLNLNPTGSFNLDNATLATGTVNGNLTNAAGTLSPGSSPGTTTINGNYIQEDSATLEIEVITTTSPIAGTDFDQLIITGDTTLQGTLDIQPTLDHDSPPPLGTEFHIVTFASHDGSFEHINGTTLDETLVLAPLFFDASGDTINDTLKLRASIPGDLNFDNKVSVADLSIFALNFETTPGFYNEALESNSWQLGDFNTDGAITVTDLSLLALNFGFELFEDGTSTPPTGLTLTDAATAIGIDPASIPEPTSITICTILSTSILTRRRHNPITR